VLAAHRAGLDTVILPKRNEPDLEEVPEEVRHAMTFIFADDVDTVLKAALTDGGSAGAPQDGAQQPVRKAQPQAEPVGEA
jgi:ATP-dependent Lon protease